MSYPCDIYVTPQKRPSDSANIEASEAKQGKAGLSKAKRCFKTFHYVSKRFNLCPPFAYCQASFTPLSYVSICV